MIVKMKSYYLKKNAEPKELEKYGFKRFGNNYSKDLICSTCDIRYYDDTRRIVFVDYPWKDARGRKVKDYINDLIKDQLIELKINYEWWAIIGKWQNYSQKKKDRIKTKLEKLNKGEQKWVKN